MTAVPKNDGSLRFSMDDARRLLEQLDHIHIVAILPDPPKDNRPQGRYFGEKVDEALARRRLLQVERRGD